jgi:hypothetical protein
MKTSIQHCARCDGDHEDLELHRLSNHEKYTHWAMCPVLGQPILVAVIEDAEPEAKVVDVELDTDRPAPPRKPPEPFYRDSGPTGFFDS